MSLIENIKNSLGYSLLSQSYIDNLITPKSDGILINRKTTDIESERSENSSFVDSFADGFLSQIFSDGILEDISSEKILAYLSSPDNYIKELSNLAMYYYISDGSVFQLFDLARILPSLKYGINKIGEKIDTDNDKNYIKCERILKKIKHKQLTRDLISQTISVGTTTGMWLGSKTNPYLYIFDKVEYFYPSYRKNGDWVIRANLAYLDTLSDNQREAFYESFYPYITKEHYEKYKDGKLEYYIDLPQSRTICLRTHTIRRNQSFGINWSTPGLFDLKHKKKLKDLEKAVANKIINSIAVLTIGNKDNPEAFGNQKLNKELKKKVYAGVKAALEKNQNKGVTVVAIPEYSDLKFPDLKSDALDPNKFESVTNDLSSSYGYSLSLTNGTGSNFSSAKINLDVFYKKIGVLLEDIEEEVYGKLFGIILPNAVAVDYSLIYNKKVPLSTKEEIDVLHKLHSEGYSIKPIIDCIDSVDYQDYISQSIYEIEVMKLREKIIPPKTSSTLGSDENGRPLTDNPDNENTAVSKGNDGNSLPE